MKNTDCLDLYNEKRPIFSQTITLPSPRVMNTHVTDSIICDGSVVEAKRIENSMIGLKSQIGDGCTISDSILIGWSPHSMSNPIRIGKNCSLKKAIIDEGVQIGDNVHLTNKENHKEFENEFLTVKEGITIVKSGVTLPNNYSF